MKHYAAENIRNIGIIGPGSSGKTSLSEAMLFSSKATDRLGKVTDGATVSDYREDEKERGISINLSLLSTEWKDSKINIIDIPGYTDFIGEFISGMSVIDSAVVVIDAQTGYDAQMDRLWDYLEEKNIPTIIFINKLDKEDLSFEGLIKHLNEKISVSLVPFQIPKSTGENFNEITELLKESSRVGLSDGIFHEKLVEAVASCDDTLVEKYLNGEKLSESEIKAGLKTGIGSRKIFPILCGSATKNIGANLLMDFIVDFLPSPKVEPNKPPTLLVFKTLSEHHLGDLSFLKVYSGTIKAGSDIYNIKKRTTERLGQIYWMIGKNRKEITDVSCGDIVVTVKLRSTSTGDILSGNKDLTSVDFIKPILFPEPIVEMAVHPSQRGEEEKMATALSTFTKEDLTFRFRMDPEIKEGVVSGMGVLHLEVLVNRAKERFGISFELKKPRIPYKETIKGKSDIQGKYKRQSGGRGQYGDVWVKIEPVERGKGFEFVDAIREGKIPKNYIPAVEKGVKEAMEQGVIAGYQVVDIRVTLYDGSFHEVDSSDMAFKIAGSMALKKGVIEAGPIILEPIMNVEVEIPEDYLGAIMGDLNSRRGRISGIDRVGKFQQIKAQVSHSDMYLYVNDLRSLTRGTGNFRMKFSHYEECPSHLAQPLIDLYNKQKEEGR